MALPPYNSLGASKKNKDTLVAGTFDDDFLKDLEFDTDFLNDPVEITVPVDAVPTAPEQTPVDKREGSEQVLSLKQETDLSEGFLEDDDLIEDDIIIQKPIVEEPIVEQPPALETFAPDSALYDTLAATALADAPAAAPPSQPDEIIPDSSMQSAGSNKPTNPPDPPASAKKIETLYTFEVNEEPEPKEDTKSLPKDLSSPFESFIFEAEQPDSLYQFDSPSTESRAGTDKSLDDIFSGLSLPASKPTKNPVELKETAPPPPEAHDEAIPKFVFVDQVETPNQTYQPVLEPLQPPEAIETVVARASQPDPLPPFPEKQAAKNTAKALTAETIYKLSTDNASETINQAHPRPDNIAFTELDDSSEDSPSDSEDDELRDTREEDEPVPDDTFFASLDTTFASSTPKSATVPPPKSVSAPKIATAESQKKPLYTVVRGAPEARPAAKSQKSDTPTKRPSASFSVQLSPGGGQMQTIRDFIPEYDTLVISLGYTLFNIRAEGDGTVLLFGNGDQLHLGDDAHPVSPNAALRSIVLK